MGTKVEIKNLNSFRSVKRALEYEIERQVGALEKGERIVQETRHFDEKEDTTKPMRTKEELNDYRYFPEPDLPPLVLSDEFIENIKNTIPELPNKKEERFIKEYEISNEQARVIAYDPKLAEYFENTIEYNRAAATDIAKKILYDLVTPTEKINSNTISTTSKKEFHSILPKPEEKIIIKDLGIINKYDNTKPSDYKFLEYKDYIPAGLKGRARDVANILLVNIGAFLNETGKKIDEINFSKETFKELLDLIENKTISLNTAKEVLDEALHTGSSPSEIVAKKGLIQITNEESIKTFVIEVLHENKAQVEQYLSGKTKVMAYLIGQVMKKAKGKANPEIVNRILYNELENLKK
jgi:Asp-tRNA(Asn)/Glu-tRNA(Gln) amidotransferase B subunit